MFEEQTLDEGKVLDFLDQTITVALSSFTENKLRLLKCMTFHASTGNYRVYVRDHSPDIRFNDREVYDGENVTLAVKYYNGLGD